VGSSLFQSGLVTGRAEELYELTVTRTRTRMQLRHPRSSVGKAGEDQPFGAATCIHDSEFFMNALAIRSGRCSNPHMSLKLISLLAPLGEVLKDKGY
jgi:hypothetical protein